MAPNEQQSKAWNGPESVHYTVHADRYDRQLAPFTELLFEQAGPGRDDMVLDVGCGSGTTTLTAARLARSALGIDISEPLLAVASERARSSEIDNAAFLVADAQIHPFDAGFDVVVSQFGLMFFDAPGAAFANLRTALVPGGRIVFVCWQALEANEWLVLLCDVLSQHAEVPVLGGLARGPGMFALQDPDEVAALLASAGFDQVEIVAATPTMLVGGGGTFDDSIDFLLGAGIVRGLLSNVESERRGMVVDAIRDRLASHYLEGTGISVGAAGWVVSASDGGRPRGRR